MKNFILYILGAGASCNVLPLSNNFSSRLSDFSQYLKSFKGSPDIGPEFEKNLTLFIEDVEWLSNESLKHVSVDTLAKKLFIKHDHKNLNRLKSILTLFFLVQQSLQNVDMR
jgi:hypothetical protein